MKITILQHHEKLNGSGYPYGIKYLEVQDITRIFESYDVGITVKLTNQIIVVVIQINPENKYSPQFKDIETGRIIDLSKTKERILKKI